MKKPLPQDVPLYNLSQAARWVGVPASTMRKWAYGRTYPAGGTTRKSERLLLPADSDAGLLSFANIAEAHILEVTRKHRIPRPDVRAAIDMVQRSDPSELHPLLTGKFYRHGKRLFVDCLGEKIAASRPVQGQRPLGSLLDHLDRIRRDLDLYLDRIDRDERDDPYQLFPVRNNANKCVVLNFHIAGGQPVIAGTGILVEFLSDLQKAGMTIPEIAGQYRLSKATVAEAIEYLAA